MTEYNTSAIFDVWDVLTDAMQTCSWPTTVLSDAGVAVWFGDPYLPPDDVVLSAERVVIAPGVQSPTEGWAPFGRLGRDEEFTAFIYLMTAISGQTVKQAADRLRELLSVVELRIRDINTEGRRPAAFSRYQPWHLQPSVIDPSVSNDPNGAIGVAEVQLRCKFRVSIPPVEG